MSAPRPAMRLLLTTVGSTASAAALLLASAVPAHAATEVFREKMHGFVVEASTFSESEDGCIFTSTFVQADRETVVYSNFAFDECEDVVLTAEFGTGSPTVFRVDKKLASADLVADVPLTDPLTGELTGEVVHLDVTWEAVGPATHVRESFSESLPGEFSFRFRTVGTFAPARVDGFGDAEVFGRIGKASTMSRSLVHDGAEL